MAPLPGTDNTQHVSTFRHASNHLAARPTSYIYIVFFFITSEASYESSYYIIACNATYANAMKVSLKIYVYILSV